MDGDKLLAILLVGMVFVAMLLTFGLDLVHWLARWWAAQGEKAAERAASPPVKRAPLVSIHWGGSTPDYVDEGEPVRVSVPPPGDEASSALDGGSSGASSGPSDEGGWTPEEILRELALVKKVDKDGVPRYLSKDKLAALVGMRAEEARAIIAEARGEPPPDGIKVRDAQGERVIAREVV